MQLFGLVCRSRKCFEMQSASQAQRDRLWVVGGRRTAGLDQRVLRGFFSVSLASAVESAG